MARISLLERLLGQAYRLPALGMLVTAAAVSGAGSGKGLLVRAICGIAFGTRPRAFTSGGERQELESALRPNSLRPSPPCS